MSYMNCRVKRVGLAIAILWGILGLIMLLPATAWARGHTVNVPPPNGVDDTANIQAALDTCVAYGPGCTVKLAAGKYLTKQVVIYNFQGTFKGMGIDSTTIEALPNLPVTNLTVTSCQPNLTDCIWPGLFEFVDGNISVSDLSIKITAVPANPSEEMSERHDHDQNHGQNLIQTRRIKPSSSSPNHSFCECTRF